MLHDGRLIRPAFYASGHIVNDCYHIESYRLRLYRIQAALPWPLCQSSVTLLFSGMSHETTRTPYGLNFVVPAS